MIINQNKKRTFGTIIVILLIIALFLLPIIFDMREYAGEDSIFSSNVFYWIFMVLCIICLPFLVWAECFLIKSMFSKKPILEITDKALTDHSSATSLGEILWDDIERVYVKGRFLVIVLKDPQKYFERIKGLKRLLIKLNKKLGYDYVCISPMAWKDQIYEVLCKIDERKPIPDFERMKRQVEISKRK